MKKLASRLTPKEAIARLNQCSKAKDWYWIITKEWSAGKFIELWRAEVPGDCEGVYEAWVTSPDEDMHEHFDSWPELRRELITRGHLK